MGLFVWLTLDMCDPIRVRVVPGEERMVTHGSEAWATFDQSAGTMSAEGNLTVIADRNLFRV